MSLSFLIKYYMPEIKVDLLFMNCFVVAVGFFVLF